MVFFETNYRFSLVDILMFWGDLGIFIGLKIVYCAGRKHARRVTLPLSGVERFNLFK